MHRFDTVLYTVDYIDLYNLGICIISDICPLVVLICCQLRRDT